jgi:hypothetical protein
VHVGYSLFPNWALKSSLTKLVVAMLPLYHWSCCNLGIYPFPFPPFPYTSIKIDFCFVFSKFIFYSPWFNDSVSMAPIGLYLLCIVVFRYWKVLTCYGLSLKHTSSCLPLIEHATGRPSPLNAHETSKRKTQQSRAVDFRIRL